jgi:hypothetical protein
MKIIGLLAICCLALAGCGDGGAGKATEEDKAALKKLATEGIGTKPAGETPKTQTPVNGETAPP